MLKKIDWEHQIGRRRAHHRFGGDIAAGTGPIFDDEWLAEPP
jgi:hypothetical protein